MSDILVRQVPTSMIWALLGDTYLLKWLKFCIAQLELIKCISTIIKTITFFKKHYFCLVPMAYSVEAQLDAANIYLF